jgi:aromatic-L-amino-acid/L-tryptophan decarboxylase
MDAAGPVSEEAQSPVGALGPNRELSLTPEQMRALGYRVIDLLVEHATSIGEQPVTQYGSRQEMEALLREPLPMQGTDPMDVLDTVERDILGHIAQLTHPRFFAFVPSPGNYVSVMADALTAAYNLFCGSWLVASGPAEIELVTIDWLRRLCGLPEGAGGLFVSGGSVATLTALVAAREARLGGDTSDAVIYCSDQTHSAVEKDAKVLGMVGDQIRALPSDGRFRLPVDAVRLAIAEDRTAGRRPFCVVGNAGATNTGAVDPLDELAELCEAERLWLHVDGAYGAPAVLTDRGKKLLKGMGRADSLAIDPHKWLFQPIEIGCVLLRDAALLPATFAVHPEYLRDVDRRKEEVNFRDYGIQLTRSFRALKLWMSFKVFGVEAFRDAIQWGIHLAEVAEAEIRALPGWEIVTPAQLAIVTFRLAPDGQTTQQVDEANQELIDATIADGFALLTSTEIHGRNVLRLCTINPRTTEDDIRQTIDRLRTFATGKIPDSSP